MDPPVIGSRVRLSELVASLSLATDLGLGQPMGHVLRSCVLGLRIADDLELGESERAVVYYVALLACAEQRAGDRETFRNTCSTRSPRQLLDRRAGLASGDR